MCLLLVHTSYVMMHWVPSSRGGDINLLYGSSSAVWCVGCIIHQSLHQPPNTTISQCEEVICHAGKVAHWVPLKPTLSSVSLCNELHLTDVVWLFALNTHQLKPLIGFSWSVYIQCTLCVCTCMSVYVHVHICVCIWLDVSWLKMKMHVWHYPTNFGNPFMSPVGDMISSHIILQQLENLKTIMILEAQEFQLTASLWFTPHTHTLTHLETWN